MKLKRIFCAALAAVLLLLCACQKDSVQSVSETVESSAVSENAESTLAAVLESTVAGELALPENPNGVATDDKNANGAAPSPSAATQNGTQAPAETVPAATQTNPSPEVPQTQTVSLSVTCHNAIAYGILDNPNFQGVVPENGVYFDNGAVEFTAGESVLTVLKRCLKSQKIVYAIGSDGYVKSIGGLAERDCGAQSGWLYKVNGELPNVSCKHYTLQAGDCVEFVYTCRMGDV
ncbi:MAG: DUF4430 domain-containing protein [Candidatus Fimenecus sp.]